MDINLTEIFQFLNNITETPKNIQFRLSRDSNFQISSLVSIWRRAQGKTVILFSKQGLEKTFETFQD